MDAVLQKVIDNNPVRADCDDCLHISMSHTDASHIAPILKTKMTAAEKSSMDEHVLHFVASHPIRERGLHMPKFFLYVPAVAALIIVFANKDAILSSREPIIPVSESFPVYNMMAVSSSETSAESSLNVASSQSVVVAEETEKLAEPKAEEQSSSVEYPRSPKEQTSSAPDIIEIIQIGNAIIQFTNKPVVRTRGEFSAPAGQTALDTSPEASEEANPDFSITPDSELRIDLPAGEGDGLSDAIPNVGDIPSELSPVTTVQSLSPAHGAEGVSLNPVFSISFSQAVSVSASSFAIYNSQHVLIEQIPFTARSLAAGESMIFQLQSSLVPGTNYSIVVPPDAFLGFAGIGESDWSFTTKPENLTE